jgi:N utilization substance protein B
LFSVNFGEKLKLADQSFFRELVHGVIKSKPRIDIILQKCSKNWKISRMPGVDRIIMRIAIFELLGCSDIPSVVSINEAVEIAKKYGTTKSASFINGVLDCIRVEEKL